LSVTSSDRIIDRQGFRPNVGIIVCNHEGEVLWGRRIGGRNSWQFPQGGMHGGETPEQAMFRELNEEIGLEPSHVSILGCTRGWLRYRLPARFIRKHERPVCIGQKQKWFLLRLDSEDSAVRVDAHDDPEFDGWRWVSWWYPVSAVVDFKRDVYRAALSELLPALLPQRKRQKVG